jgi:predicted enzyme related to lactoylglutathione lyase
MADGDPGATISGIGGFFFRCEDPEALADWYAQHFGISKVSDGAPWSQAAGPTVFSPFPADTDYFGRMDQPFMLNFRVPDLDAALAALDAAGVRIDENVEELEYGRFAWVYDPEDTKIELWEPPQ